MNTTNKPINQLSNKKINYKTVIFFSIVICLLSYFSIGLFPSTAMGDMITNGNDSIDVGNIDTNPQPTQKPQPQVLGAQSPKPEFTTGPDYTITTSTDSFSFQVSENAIDYGILSSTNPVLRNSTIFFSGPKSGAEILAYENNPLQSLKNDTIENTTCDNGACSPIIAALWTNTLTYGFGYRCDSQRANACDPQFSTSNYFKQYSNDSLNQLPASILDNYANSKETEGTITYKVNISGTQKPAGYFNSITYLAVPNF